MKFFTFVIFSSYCLYSVCAGVIPSLNPVGRPFDDTNPFTSTMKVNRELQKAGDRSVMHIEFDIEGSKMQYEAGDHVGIYPKNDRNLVELMGELCIADLDEKYSPIDSDANSSKKRLSPSPTTYRSFLTNFVELTMVPDPHVLGRLAEHCSDETDRELLTLLSSNSPEGTAEYQSWVKDAYRNIVHILEDMASCRPPIELVCEILPALRPRYYSISSSAKLHPNTVHVTMMLKQYVSKTGRINKGVTSSFLASKGAEELKKRPVRVPVFIRNSKFHLPRNSNEPVIMIGAGTGLAPFRGFIQERDLFRRNGKTVGNTILYFGSRKRSEDFLYEEELNDYVRNGTLKLRTAFSRDQEEKIYVTLLLENDADLVWQVIGNNGHIFICGDGKSMAKDVRNVLLNVIAAKGNMDEASALQFLTKMEEQKRYSADVYG